MGGRAGVQADGTVPSPDELHVMAGWALALVLTLSYPCTYSPTHFSTHSGPASTICEEQGTALVTMELRVSLRAPQYA